MEQLHVSTTTTIMSSVDHPKQVIVEEQIEHATMANVRNQSARIEKQTK